MWKTNYGALEKHVEKYPEELKKYLGLGVGKSMPSRFEAPAVEGFGLPK